MIYCFEKLIPEQTELSACVITPVAALPLQINKENMCAQKQPQLLLYFSTTHVGALTPALTVLIVGQTWFKLVIPPRGVRNLLNEGEV